MFQDFFVPKIRVKRASVSDNSPKMTHYGSTWAYLFKLEAVCTMTLAKKNLEHLQSPSKSSRDHFKLKFRSLAVLVRVLQDFE